ncbi:MAG: NnrU family protein [Alphaproteobacteria bacterium]|nr:NnrU family protein [Alphaproteobacteria bacterium]
MSTLFLLLSLAAHAQEPDTSALSDLGCLACHSTDGAPRSGPTLAGLWGQERPIVREGQTVTEVFDRAALERSLATPRAEVRAGYSPTMPTFELVEAQLNALEATLQALEPPEEPPRHSPPWTLAVAAVLFAFGHMALSSLTLRPRLASALGEARFQAVYSLLIGGSFVWMLWAWYHAPPIVLWTAPIWTTHLPISVMPLVFIGLVAGYTTPGPTQAGQAGKLHDAEPARGILRITRHPANLSMALWALIHLPANGELRNVLLMGSVLALGVLGSLHIDARRAAKDPEGWARFAEKTSLVPFLAILQGRNRFVWSEIGFGRVLGGLAAFGAFVMVHGWVIGASPWPR